MNAHSPLILIGIGTAGCTVAHSVRRAFGDGLRFLLCDTDACSGRPDEPFALLGGERLAGRGAGGDIVTGRLAAEDSVKSLDEHLEAVRLAVIVTSLGGGTGGGATVEAAKHLAALGIPAVVFATLPFTFEGADRQRNARGIMSLVEDAAAATFLLPLDKLVGETDNMAEAFRHATDTLAAGVTLFWRLVEKPGYLRIDVERLRHLLTGAGRGRFATVTVQGPGRAQEAVDQIIRNDLLAVSSGPVKATLCGILAGNDLLLSEVGTVADGIRSVFGGLSFDLATVNDNDTFAGRMSVVVMLFESNGRQNGAERPRSVISGPRRKGPAHPGAGSGGRGRFHKAAPTIWNGEDLDIPTFVRRNIGLDL